MKSSVDGKSNGRLRPHDLQRRGNIGWSNELNGVCGVEVVAKKIVGNTFQLGPHYEPSHATAQLY